MKAQTFEEAWKTGEIDESFVEQCMCPVCPWTLGKISRGAYDNCEGNFCEEAYGEAMEKGGAFD